jgi:hypothetical protein
MTTKNMGAQGFRWFLGFIESIEDPDKLGQVKVRVPDIHGDMQVEDLPYATMMMPTTSASLYGVGISPTGIKVGTMVVGFFADGSEYNVPIIMGTINKINENDENKHDVSKLAREINSIDKKLFGIEPSSAYKSKYPYNKTITTESGHAIELDDTPGSERIHVYHKSGTYVEVDPRGRMVTKVVGDDYEIVVKDKNVLVAGNVKIQVNGNVDMKVAGSYSLNVAGPIVMNGSTVNINNGSKGAARIGDSVPDSETIGEGSGTVFIGG